MTDKDDKRASASTRMRWAAIAFYGATGWAAAEALLAVRERFGLPQALDNLVLGALLAGLVVCALVLATRRLARRSPVLSVSRILAIAVVASSIALGVSAWLGQTAQSVNIPSVAVLPCDYQGIEDHAFLGPATAEELHAKLAKVSGLQIPAWRSVLKSVQVGEDKQQIAHILRVQHLTSCAIREDEQRIEVTASILDPETEKLVWSGRQTYASADLVGALSDISLAITDALSVRLTAEVSDRLTRAPTSSPEAYEHYLRARQAQGTRQWDFGGPAFFLAIGKPDYDLAMTHYRAAVDLDPGFAESWAGMATITDAYGITAEGQGLYGDVMKSHTELAREFARHALSLDDCNAEAILLLMETYETTELNDFYQNRVEQIQRAIECEPNNVSAWILKVADLSLFNFWPTGRTEPPVEELHAALDKAISLDPTSCKLVNIYIARRSDPVFTPNPEDRLTPEEGLQAIRSGLLVNPECGNLYDSLAGISEEQGRLDEAIAWKMRRYELDPSQVPACRIAHLFANLGFLQEAYPWANQALEAGFSWCMNKTDFECRQSREWFFSDHCKVRRLEVAKQMIASDFLGGYVAKYRHALFWGQSSGRPDLLRQWLDAALKKVGSDDPVAILEDLNPKRMISVRHKGLELVPIFRDLGLDDAAERMLQLCRRDPKDPEQIVWDMDNYVYVDARYRSLIGEKAEAMKLLEEAVHQHQGLNGDPSPGRWNLMFDRALDPLREDPEYAPRLDALIEEYDAWLAPARERMAKAIETGDWGSLRTLIEETPAMLAASPRADD